MRTLRIRFAMLCALGLLAGAATAQAVQLKSGAVVVGDITDATEDGFLLKRLDTGGTLQIKWSDLSAGSTAQLKQLFKLSVEDEAEVTAEADVIAYELPGGQRIEVVGVITDSTKPKVLVVRTKAMPGGQDIPRETVRGMTKRPVRALDLFTKDEFYNQKLQELAPGDDAAKQILLGDLMLRVRDYEHAKLHYVRAKELGGGNQSRELDAKLAKLDLFEKSAAEKNLLDDIAASAGRGEFPRAKELIQKFNTTYPQSKLRAEFDQLTTRVDKLRDRWLVSRVAEMWYMAVPSQASHKIGERNVTFQQAKAYAESQMGKDIRAQIAKSLGIPEDEVKKQFDKRLSLPAVLKQSFYSYGVGSWLLGSPAAVIENTTVGKAEAKDAEKLKPADKDTEALLKRLKEMRDRAKAGLAAGQPGQPGQQKPQTDEEFWASDFTPQQKALWLQAYYAEKAGDMKVLRAEVDPCVNCAGRGEIPELGTGGQPRNVPCILCHKVKYTRRVRVE